MNYLCPGCKTLNVSFKLKPLDVNWGNLNAVFKRLGNQYVYICEEKITSVEDLWDNVSRFV